MKPTSAVTTAPCMAEITPIKKWKKLKLTERGESKGVPMADIYYRRFGVTLRGAISDPITERGFRYVFRTCPRASDFGAATVTSGSAADTAISVCTSAGLNG